MLRPRLIRAPLRPRLGVSPAQSPLLPLACQKRLQHAAPEEKKKLWQLLPPLPYNLNGQCSGSGLQGFLSPTAFRVAWEQYQTHVTQRLAALTYGMSLLSLLSFSPADTH